MKNFNVLIDGKQNTLSLVYSSGLDRQYNTEGNKTAHTFRNGSGPETWPKNKEVKTNGHTYIILSESKY